MPERQSFGEFVQSHPPESFDNFVGGGGDPKSEDPGFWNTLGEAAKNGPRALMDFLTGHPIDQLRQRGERFNEAATEAWKRGEHGTALALGIAGILPPGTGEEAIASGEEFGAGHLGAGSAHAVLALAPFLVGPAARGASRVAKTAAPAASTVSSFARGAAAEVPAATLAGLEDLNIIRPTAAVVKPTKQIIQAGIRRVGTDKAAAARAEQLANPPPIPERVRLAREAFEKARAEDAKAAPTEFQPVQHPMGMDIEGNMRPGPLKSGRRVGPVPIGRSAPTAPHEPIAPLDPNAPRTVTAVEQAGAELRAQTEAAQAARAEAIAQAAAEAQLLDDIALGQTGKKFSKLSAAEQGSVRGVRERIRTGPEEPPALSPVEIQARIDARQAAQPASPPESAPTPAPQEPVQPSAPTPRALPASTPRQIAQRLFEEMRRNGTIGEPAPETAPLKIDQGTLDTAVREVPPAGRAEMAKANYRAVKEGATPVETAGPAYEAAGRGNKAQRIAAAMHEGGVTLQEAGLMEQADWNDMSVKLGEHPPSTATQAEVIFHLKRLKGGK